MSKNVENRTENRTLAVILDELNASVDKYNESTDTAERVQLQVEHKKLVEEYNQASYLDAYATFMDDKTPLVALAKAYYYDTVSVKDTPHNEKDKKTGAIKSTITRSVKDGCKKFDVAKFIEWTEERNKSVAAEKDWKVKIGAARNSIEAEWKKFFASNKDSHSMSIGKAKKALQAMFDALVFIPCENDKTKNAIIANGDVAKWVLGYANSRKDSKAEGKITVTGYVLPKATWNTLCLDALHMAVEGKTFEIIYGDPEKKVADKVEANAKVEAKTKAKTTAKAKAEPETKA